jgi:hypothetical protein
MFVEYIKASTVLVCKSLLKYFQDFIGLIVLKNWCITFENLSQL